MRISATYTPMPAATQARQARFGDASTMTPENQVECFRGFLDRIIPQNDPALIYTMAVSLVNKDTAAGIYQAMVDHLARPNGRFIDVDRLALHQKAFALLTTKPHSGVSRVINLSQDTAQSAQLTAEQQTLLKTQHDAAIAALTPA